MSVNYAWQVPCAVHQYGRRWDAMAGLSIPLILTGVWFAVAMVATVRGRWGGRTALASFLVTEVAFYAVHNAGGAFGADLPLDNPVLLVASALGYGSTAAALVYLVLMARTRRAERSSSALSGRGEGEASTLAWSVARFAALDLYGTKGTPRRRRLVLTEFVGGTLGMFAVGGFLLSRGAWGWGGWLLGCALNYAALTVHAIGLRKTRPAERGGRWAGSGLGTAPLQPGPGPVVRARGGRTGQARRSCGSS